MSKFKNVKPGEFLSSTMYMQVLSKTQNGVKVKDALNGNEFEVRGASLIEQMRSSQQFEKEEKVSRTDLANNLTSAGDAVFTVVFDKQDGTERTLVGKLINAENQMGRSNVEDLEIATGSRLRQVDHRTLKSLILNGVKYTVKK